MNASTERILDKDGPRSDKESYGGDSCSGKVPSMNWNFSQKVEVDFSLAYMVRSNIIY